MLKGLWLKKKRDSLFTTVVIQVMFEESGFQDLKEIKKK